MKQSRFHPRLIVGIIVALFFGIALYLRVVHSYDQVFVGDWIKFTGVDAYYHMRLVDSLFHHFPQAITFDPYTFYPYGVNVPWPPFFDWLIVATAWLIGLGSPTQHTVDVVGVYFPAILAALTVIPVYFIGKELFNRWTGVIAAGLIAILPGEFLGRSILGFTDHHVAEVLFTSIAMLFLILAVKTAKQNRLTLSRLRDGDWATIARPLIYSLLTGIFLGVYLLTWVGGLLFVFLIFVYFVVQFIIDHLRNESTDYLAIVSPLSFLAAAAISLPLMPPIWTSSLYLPSLLIATATPLVLCGISRLMAARKLKPAYYPLTLVGLGGAGLAIFYVVAPSLLKSMVARFGIFTPAGASLTILEVQPLLFPGGNFSLSVAWGNFTTGFFLSFISLGILIYFAFKQARAERTLLIVWSLVILAATLGQRRFAYYFAVNVALLTAYLSILIFFVIRFIVAYLRNEPGNHLSWQVLESPQVEKLITRPEEMTPGVKRRKARGKRRSAGMATTYATMTLGVVVVFFLCFFPNIGLANIANRAHFLPSDAWCQSLSWLKDNTPDPFNNPDFYYELYQPPEENYNYPESSYSIMSWWDYGHWITRIAHRIPVSNPFQQGASQAARFFTAPDETSASERMDKLGARYVIIDYATATAKFHGVAAFAGSSKEKFYDVYYQPQGNKLVPGILFHPEYYRSMAIRLYNFDGEEVLPQDSAVICYRERVTPEGQSYKEITSLEHFSTYEEAEACVSSQESGNYRIVSDNPFISPVPLGALEHYRLVYSSDGCIMQPGAGMVPEVKIFEYIK